MAYNGRVLVVNRSGQQLFPLPRRALVSRRDLILASLWRAQAQDVTFWTDVNLVDLPVTARDKTGRFVKDLTRDDFSVEEDGRSQIILDFLSGIEPAAEDRSARGHKPKSDFGS
jgi:hypothetical protein